jgi:hypothetical protein
MNPIRDLWNLLTYRNEWTNASPGFPAKKEGDQYELRTFQGDLLLFDVDRKSGRVRVAAARRAKEER